MKTACLAGICACGAEDATSAQTTADGNAPAEAAKPAGMPHKWIAALLPLLAKGDREYARRLLKGCAASHYEDLKMQATVDRFRGKLDAFLDFLRKEWGWIVAYDREGGVILVNENKSSCVCPLVQKNHGPDLGILCHCSEGFNEKMFSAVAGFKVRVEVTESILRGNKSCKYRIDLRPQQS
jgi:predicted ArsR family transcriptional regulator